MDGDEFLRRMRAGDVRVWDELMPVLRKVALGACSDLKVFDQLRNDIVQEVAMKVFTRWESYQGGSKLLTWIYCIARNCCLDELRKRQVRAESPVMAGRGDGNDVVDGGQTVLLDYLVDASASDMEQRLCIQQVLAELEAQGPVRGGSVRAIEMLRYCVINDPSTEELAAFLGAASPGAAKERKSYVLKRVRELCRMFCGHDECAFTTKGIASGTA